MITRHSINRNRRRGFASYILVLSTGAFLSLLLVFTYRRAMAAHTVQSQVQLRTDYREKEDAVLRSIVAITPNRAMRAMRSGSSASSTVSNPLRWQNIFSESLDLANARTSVDPNLRTSLNLGTMASGNSGDSALNVVSRVFLNAGGDSTYRSTYVSAGINRTLGTGYPDPLETPNDITIANDKLYPIISGDKRYGQLAQSGVGLPVANYPSFNVLKYPRINFGYAKPGEDFVAKRNWWAFALDMANHDDDKTDAARLRRNFVLSIYEIPSQLAISASSFMSLGQFGTGEDWNPDRVKIDGGVFAGRAVVEGTADLAALASRRGMSMTDGTAVGGQNFASNPFTPGVREEYQMTQGEFFPVSLASESGRVAFVPINRGAEFFDRFHPNVRNAETNTLSPTTWNKYSVGALQCAMQLDVVEVESATNPMPTKLRFGYVKPDGTTGSYSEAVAIGVKASLPPGFVKVADEHQSYDFGDAVVDVAYGANGNFIFQPGVTGVVTFDNTRFYGTFNDPLVGVFKAGYFRPSAPYKVMVHPSNPNGFAIGVFPERIPAFLNLIGAAGTDKNHSLVVNVDYTNLGPTYPLAPQVDPCVDTDYALILQECANLTSFTKGFSLVTNLRAYIGDDFNIQEATSLPAGYTPPTGEKFYPPCSLFAPEKRYGVEVDPFAVSMGGQIGSLKKADKVNTADADPTVVRPLDSRNRSGQGMGADRIKVNLRPIRHPGELPPVTMMNWLVVLEERSREFVNY